MILTTCEDEITFMFIQGKLSELHSLAHHGYVAPEGKIVRKLVAIQGI